MNDFNRDIIISLMFLTGIWSFISGQFIISTLIFASAAIFSNIAIRATLNSEREVAKTNPKTIDFVPFNNSGMN